MAVSTTTVEEQIRMEREQGFKVEIARLKKLVRDYDKELDSVLDVWDVSELDKHFEKYLKLNKRAYELKAID